MTTPLSLPSIRVLLARVSVAAQSYQPTSTEPDARAESGRRRDDDITPGRSDDRGWPRRRRALAIVAIVATVALTAQILIAHGITHRRTSLGAAIAWSIATVGTWTMVAALVMASADRFARGFRDLAIVGIVGLAAAVALRALVDPLLPTPAELSMPLSARLAVYAVRWAGPGAVTIVAILLARVVWGTPPVNTDEPIEQLVVRIGAKSVVVPTREIRWIEAAGNYAYLHLAGRRLVARATMAELEARLDAQRFVRVHRSAIVALGAVTEVRSGGVVVDASVVPVSRVGRRMLEEQLGARV